ncbi:hypothetical protein KDX30_15595 [Pseudomonas sp. CDFA 553]|uniref:hypothetical protein n=1 Tax=Pseudomonas quasicaspiana TaxID=2829821 RepID=UPI003872BF2B|nr:hypothetical protein [Pseudomonas quasicaspiana]
MSYSSKLSAHYLEPNEFPVPPPSFADDDVRFSVEFGEQDTVRFMHEADTQMPGDDWKTDLYYAAVHLRELIERATKTRWHAGALTPELLEKVIRFYKVSDLLAAKYSSDVTAWLEAATLRRASLYFCEK